MDHHSRTLLLSAAVALAIAGSACAQDVADGRQRGPSAIDLLPGLANVPPGMWSDTTPVLANRSGDRHFHLGSTAADQDFYLIGGSGGPAALEGNISSLALGAGYRQPLSEAMSWHLDLRNHVLQKDYFGDRDAASNFEVSLGVQLSF